MTWTRFMDMHSGGGLKEKWQYIYIEAPQEDAEIIFYNKFGHNPNRVTCTCCGSDYSIRNENETLDQVTAYERGCRHAYFKDGIEIEEDKAWKRGKGLVKGCIEKYVEEPDDRYSFHPYRTLEEYLNSGECLVINQSEISQKDKEGTLPQQGYVWID